MAYVYDNGSLGRRVFHPRFGFTSVRGLGDASYDAALAAYQKAHALWVLQTNAYNRNMQGWQAGEAAKAAAYASASAAYAAQQAGWKKIQQQLAAQGVYFQSDFMGCVYPAQLNAWKTQCANQQAAAAVKGLGASNPSGPVCLLAQLPECPDTPIPLPVPPVAAPKPVAPGPEPQPPTPPPVTSTPTSTTLPPPVVVSPPVTSSGPTTTPDPVISTTPTASTKSGGLLSSGLILLVVAGGGYAIYRTLKKPKAA